MGNVKYFKVRESQDKKLLDYSRIKEAIYGGEEGFFFLATSQESQEDWDEISDSAFISIKESLIFPDPPEVQLMKLKAEYLPQIKDADLLGDKVEKERLQQEYLIKKAAIEEVIEA